MHCTRILMGLAGLVAMVSPSSGSDGLRIDSYTVDGGTSVLTFAGVPTAVVYVAESALSPTGGWQTAQAARAPAGQLSVHMNGQPTCFYRVVAGVTNRAAPEPAGMVMIPAGGFQMGESLGDGSIDELPVHTVNVSAFYINRTEVTWAKWQEVRTWAATNSYDIGAVGWGKASNHPVQMVNWYDAVKWCNARSQMESKTACYTRGGITYKAGEYDDIACNWAASGYRLPTEAEWEKAARGGPAGQRFPWGAGINHGYANYWANGSAYTYDTSPYTAYTYHPAYDDVPMPYTSPVGPFTPNGHGLYDMAGNVMEWCWDWYDSTYYGSSPGSNPDGPAEGSSRVYRGGSWNKGAYNCRAACRYLKDPANRFLDCGFRTVLPPGQP